MHRHDRWDIAVSAEGGGCCREMCSAKYPGEVDRDSVDLASRESARDSDIAYIARRIMFISLRTVNKSLID